MSQILDFIAWSTKARLKDDPEWGGKLKKQEERIEELEFALNGAIARIAELGGDPKDISRYRRIVDREDGE